MPDNVTLSNGALATFIASTDEAVSGHVQRNKLTYSADGSDVHIGADVNGLDVDVTRLPSTTVGAQTAVTVTTAATLLIAAGATRKGVSVRPNADMFIGYTNTVTTTTGFPVYSGEVWEETYYTGALYGITAASSANVRVLEAQ